jgi:hypothetical protein
MRQLAYPRRCLFEHFGVNGRTGRLAATPYPENRTENRTDHGIAQGAFEEVSHEAKHIQANQGNIAWRTGILWRHHCIYGLAGLSATTSFLGTDFTYMYHITGVLLLSNEPVGLVRNGLIKVNKYLVLMQ